MRMFYWGLTKHRFFVSICENPFETLLSRGIFLKVTKTPNQFYELKRWFNQYRIFLVRKRMFICLCCEAVLVRFSGGFWGRNFVCLFRFFFIYHTWHGMALNIDHLSFVLQCPMYRGYWQVWDELLHKGLLVKGKGAKKTVKSISFLNSLI